MNLRSKFRKFLRLKGAVLRVGEEVAPLTDPDELN